jgi:hypothetical protein
VWFISPQSDSYYFFNQHKKDAKEQNMHAYPKSHKLLGFGTQGPLQNQQEKTKQENVHSLKGEEENNKYSLFASNVTSK